MKLKYNFESEILYELFKRVLHDIIVRWGTQKFLDEYIFLFTTNFSGEFIFFLNCTLFFTLPESFFFLCLPVQMEVFDFFSAR